MPDAKPTTLYSPSGEKYATSDPAEITRLKVSHGYTDKAPSASKSDDTATKAKK